MTKSLSYALTSETTLPHNWSWSTIGKIADVVAGNPAPQGDEYFRDGSYPFLRVQDMGRLGNDSHIFKTHDYINNKAIQSLRLFPKGSVLFTKSGASTLLNQRAILGCDMYVVSHIAATIPNENILSEWLYYWLKTIDFNKLAHATTLPSLPLSKAKDIPIPVAPPTIQKLIVAEIEKQFSRLDEAVAALKRIKANLKRYKASVLKAAVEGKLTEEWRKNNKDVESGEKLLKRILAERKKKWEEKNPSKKYREPVTPDTSNLPELPNGWVWANIGQIYDVIGGGTPSTSVSQYWNGDIPWITSADIHGVKDIRPRKQITEKAIESSATNLVPKGSLIVVTRVGLGKIAITKTPLCFSQDSQALVRNNSLLFPSYSLYYLFNAVQRFKYEHRGTTIAGVTKKQLADLEFAVPPLQEQKQVVAEIESRLSVADEIEAAVEINLKRAERLRQAILKKAFSGRLVQ